MPTALPRIQITETAVVKHALEIAGGRWPGAPKSEQLTNLLAEAVERADAEQRERQGRREAALVDLRAALAGCYPPGYLDDLRAEERY